MKGREFPSFFAREGKYSFGVVNKTAMSKTFVVSDETINSYGFRVLTSGINTKNFLKNPIGLFNHQRYDDWSTEYSGPVVKWSNLVKQKDGSMVADPVFDENDPKGKVIANKVENGFLSAASIGFKIIEMSDDPKYMLPGQKYPTVTKCELVEISIVDIPSNKNAIALYDESENRIELNDDTDIMKLSAYKSRITSPPENMKKLSITAGLTALAAFLGLESGKDHEVELSDAQLQKLNDDVASLATLKQEKLKAEQDLAEAKTAHTSALATKDTEITNLKSERDGLQEKVNKLPGAAPSTPASTTLKEGETTEEPENEFLSDTDKKMKELRESVYGKEDKK